MKLAALLFSTEIVNCLFFIKELRKLHRNVIPSIQSIFRRSRQLISIVISRKSLKSKKMWRWITPACVVVALVFGHGSLASGAPESESAMEPVTTVSHAAEFTQPAIDLRTPPSGTTASVSQPQFDQTSPVPELGTIAVTKSDLEQVTTESHALELIQPATDLGTHRPSGTSASVSQPQFGQTSTVPVPGTVETFAQGVQAQAQPPASANPETPAPAPSISPTPAQKLNYQFSYLGIGVNLGTGGEISGLGTTSFAAFSKFALSPSFSVRPALLISNYATALISFTYDFPISGPGHIAPYVGLGIQSSELFTQAPPKTSDVVLTIGMDYPINSFLAFTAGVNSGLNFNNSGIGVLLGLAYIFSTSPPGEASGIINTQEPNVTPSEVSTPRAEAAETEAEEAKERHITENWNAHFQSTFIYQYKPAFNSPYTGTNSLLGTVEDLTYTLSATGYFGVRLWKGGEFYVNPEMSSAIAVSGLLGLGGLSNGENQKGGSPVPNVYMARAFLRQTWSFGGTPHFIESGQNQLAEIVDSRRLVLTLGKLSVTDLFGPNRFSSNPRTQFINYSFLTYLAMDYGADGRGYAVGAALEYFLDNCTFRIGRFSVPTTSNGFIEDWNLLTHYNDVIEAEYSYAFGDKPGKVRLMGFHTRAIMASFQDALDLWQANGEIEVPSIADVRNGEKDQFGWGFAVEQSLGSDVGLFLIFSGNDGYTENWSFTDVEGAFAGGFSIQGNGWGRPQDTLGIGYASNTIGRGFQEYLAAGGLGTFIGDGQLNYAPEEIFETYYNYKLGPITTLGLDFQYITNPGYNADRGPVFLFGTRLHVEF